jgi:hypothetical protein
LVFLFATGAAFEAYAIVFFALTAMSILAIGYLAKPESPPSPEVPVPPWRKPRWLLVYAIIYCWVATALALGSSTFFWNINTKPNNRPLDTVWRTDQSSISGRIVRVIDRGVIIMLRSPDSQVMFIPKEQVRDVRFGSDLQ